MRSARTVAPTSLQPPVPSPQSRLLGNHLGSTAFVTNAFGTVTQKTIYYPWGQLWASAGTVVDERFAALGLRDSETSEDLTLFRLYDPRLYRWLSPDPAGLDAAWRAGIVLPRTVRELPAKRERRVRGV